MMKRTIQRLATEMAKATTAMVAPVLLPSEKKEFFLKVLKLTKELVEACHRRAGRDKLKIKPSMN